MLSLVCGVCVGVLGWKRRWTERLLDVLSTPFTVLPASHLPLPSFLPSFLSFSVPMSTSHAPPMRLILACPARSRAAACFRLASWSSSETIDKFRWSFQPEAS